MLNQSKKSNNLIKKKIKNIGNGYRERCLTARSQFWWLEQGKCLEWEKLKTIRWNCSVEFRSHLQPESSRRSGTRYGCTAPETS